MQCFWGFWLERSLCEPSATQDRQFCIQKLYQGNVSSHCYISWAWHTCKKYTLVLRGAALSTNQWPHCRSSAQLNRRGCQHPLPWDDFFRSYFLPLLALIEEKKSIAAERLIRGWDWKTQSLNKHWAKLKGGCCSAFKSRLTPFSFPLFCVSCQGKSHNIHTCYTSSLATGFPFETLTKFNCLSF